MTHAKAPAVSQRDVLRLEKRLLMQERVLLQMMDRLDAHALYARGHAPAQVAAPADYLTPNGDVNISLKNAPTHMLLADAKIKVESLKPDVGKEQAGGVGLLRSSWSWQVGKPSKSRTERDANHAASDGSTGGQPGERPSEFAANSVEEADAAHSQRGAAAPAADAGPGSALAVPASASSSAPPAGN